MSEPKYLIVFPDCLVAPGCKTVGTWTLSRVTGNLGIRTDVSDFRFSCQKLEIWRRRITPAEHCSSPQRELPFQSPISP